MLQAKIEHFYRKSENLMSVDFWPLPVLVCHVSSPAWRPHTKLYKLGLNFSVKQTWDLDMLYIYESSVTLHFVGFFRSTVSKLFFHWVTVKTLYMLSSLSKRNHLLNCSNFCSNDLLTSRPWLVRMCRRLDCEQSLIFLCKVTTRETQARKRR